MNNEGLYIGIDTSNYKTSIALIDDESDIVFERSELLEVKSGKLGLRQSEAFYQHSMRLPEFTEDALNAAGCADIKAIAYSAWPRRQQGSYMPCFNAGINAARILSSSLKIPAYAVSHQEGHAAAVIPQDQTDRCGFMHLSGGTSELLIITPCDSGYDVEIVGGTKDISFGQLIDRAGVALGYPFPAGIYLDRLATEHTNAALTDFRLPRVKTDDGYFNLSGAETRLLKYIQDKGISSDDTEITSGLAAELFRYIADILMNSAEYLINNHEIKTVYMAGGVASSAAIRNIIHTESILDIRFGEPALSGDNAVGVARLAKRIHTK